MKVQKLVSLTPETFKKAKEMDNFSLFVRDCLRGTLRLKHEALKRRISHLEELVCLAYDQGSQYPDFIEEVKNMGLRK